MSENNGLKDCELIPNGSDELKPPSPPGGLDTEVQPTREFVRLPTSTPNGLASGGTLKSDNDESTNLEVAPDSNHRHEPQPPCGFATSTLDLPPDANREDDETSSQLDPKKMRAALALALGQSETDVARFVGVNRSTVYRWQQEANFVAEMNRHKREYLAEQRSRLQTLLEQAIATLDS